ASASGCKAISEISSPARSTQRNVLCKIVFEPVINVPSISRRTPIIPRGSVIPVNPSTTN
ncbi:ABC-type amino acid transport system, permease component, partial [Listeria monocytogenes FSL F2-208]